MYMDVHTYIHKYLFQQYNLIKLLMISFLLVIQLHQDDLEHLNCHPIPGNPKRDEGKQMEKKRAYQYL